MKISTLNRNITRQIVISIVALTIFLNNISFAEAEVNPNQSLLILESNLDFYIYGTKFIGVGNDLIESYIKESTYIIDNNIISVKDIDNYRNEISTIKEKVLNKCVDINNKEFTSYSFNDAEDKDDLYKACMVGVDKLNEFKSYVDSIISESSISNDPLSLNQKYLRLVNIPKIWDKAVTKKDIVVAVVDDGVYPNSTDLSGKFWQNNDEVLNNGIDDDKNGFVDDKYGWNFTLKNNDINPNTLDGHGTMVAGIIAAQRNNNTLIAGIADRAKIMPLIACDESGCNDSGIISAIRYAVDNGAQVINLSLGGNNVMNYSNKFDDVIKYAWDRNVIVVIAAGNGDNFNQGTNTTDFKVSPVCNDENNKKMIIGVGASTSDNKYRTTWSNWGDCIDVYAPGEKIISTSIPFYNNIPIKVEDGTSFSAPIVSGIIAQLLSVYPSMKNETVYDYLLKSSNRGIIDAYSLFEFVKRDYDPFKEDASKSKYVSAILDLRSRGIVSGFDDGSFKPFNNLTRAEFMKIISKSTNINPEGVNCYPDIGNEWYAGYICKGKELGMINGNKDGKFYPSNNISVVEALKITLNTYKFDIRAAIKNEDWWTPYVEYARDNNLLLDSFSDNKRKINREEMAELIFRVTEKINISKDRALQQKNDEVIDGTNLEISYLGLINASRIDKSLPTLTLDNELTNIARAHAEDIAKNLKKTTSIGSNGMNVLDRLKDEGIPFLEASENVAKVSTLNRTKFEAIEALHSQIMALPDNEENQKANVLSTFKNFSVIGVGIYEDDENNLLYVVSDFISI